MEVLPQERQADFDDIAISVILIDIDQFNLFNDTYGRRWGDDWLAYFHPASNMTRFFNRQWLREGTELARGQGRQF